MVGFRGREASLERQLALKTHRMEEARVEHPNAALIHAFYEARAQDDEEAIRSALSEGVVWHEPDVGDEHTGDLHGPDAVLAMMREARMRSGGTFRLRPREVVANGRHAVALVDWTAEREGETLMGKEVTVLGVRDGKVVEAHFHQDDADLDRRFWE